MFHLLLIDCWDLRLVPVRQRVVVGQAEAMQEVSTDLHLESALRIGLIQLQQISGACWALMEDGAKIHEMVLFGAVKWEDSAGEKWT